MGTEVVSYEDLIKQEIERSKGRNIVHSNWIKVKGKEFVFPGDLSTSNPFEAIVLDYVFIQRLWGESYVPPKPGDPPRRPLCFAYAAKEEDLSPHPSAQQPQVPPDENGIPGSCSDCPHNVWGTGKNGRGRKCTGGHILALLSPSATAKDKPLLLRTSPTAIGGWNKLVNQMLMGTGKPFNHSVVMVSFNPALDYASVAFRHVRVLSASEYQQLVMPRLASVSQMIEQAMASQASGEDSEE